MNSAAWAFTMLFISVALVVCARYFFFTRMRSSKSALTAGKEYRSLADEYRRLSDMAIPAPEHVDLTLTDLSVRVDALKDQLDQEQRILKEVEETHAGGPRLHPRRMRRRLPRGLSAAAG